MMEKIKTGYAKSGEVTIAYQTRGQGVPLVFVPGFVSHVEENWEAPPYRHALERATRLGQLITFDKRGTGLSDRSVNFGSIEQRMDDIRAVMDAVRRGACRGGWMVRRRAIVDLIRGNISEARR